MANLKKLALCADPVGRDSAANPNAFEWILFAREGSVKDFIIEHLINPQHQHGHPPEYKPWVKLDVEPPAYASEVMFRSGHGEPRMDGSRYVYFTGRSNPALNNTGDRIRVKDPSGQVVTEFPVPANYCDVLPKPPGPKPVTPPPHHGPLRY